MKKIKQISNRLLYLDNLRLFIVLSVILYHSAVTYGPIGTYFFYDRSAINDPIVKYPLAFIAVFFKSFFMGLLFIISGYFTPISFDKYGPKQFLIKKLAYLGTPLLLLSATLFPLLDFYFFYNIRNLTFPQILYIYFTHPDPGHLWYIALLLLFTFIYVILNKYFDQFFLKLFYIPKKILILISIITILLTSFTIRIWVPIGVNFLRIPIAYLPQIVVFFLFGMVLYRNHWLDLFTSKNICKYSLIVFLLISFLFLIYLYTVKKENSLVLLYGGFNVYSFIYTLWETIFSIFISIFLFNFFKYKINFPIKMSADSFGLYIVSPLILVLFQLLILDLKIYPLYKFFITVILTIVFSEILVHNIKKWIIKNAH